MSGISSDPKVVEGVDLTITREKDDSRNVARLPHAGTLPVHDKEENALELERFEAKKAISAKPRFRGGRQSTAIVFLLCVPVWYAIWDMEEQHNKTTKIDETPRKSRVSHRASDDDYA
jgi:hypothetical protein